MLSKKNLLAYTAYFMQLDNLELPVYLNLFQIFVNGIFLAQKHTLHDLKVQLVTHDVQREI